MTKLYLFLIDIIIPTSVGLIVILMTNLNFSENIYIYSYIIFGITTIVISFLNGYYENYFLIHFSEKIKIFFITAIFSIFFQMIFYLYNLIELYIFIILSWMIIPILILLVRYIIKIKIKSINKIKISIIGKLYIFNEHECKTLINKGFKVYFYDSTEDFLDKNDIYENESDLVVINLNENISNDKKSLHVMNTISLGKFMENYLRKIHIDDNNGLNNINQYKKSDYLFKRLIDYISAIVLLPLLIIISIFVIVMKMIKGLDGSFIFFQKRYGINQKVFTLFKLRTMHIDSDSEGNTVKNDNRVYSFARTLRKFRLDELPQIINIILGEMHLVGPRAEWIVLADEYSKNIENYSLRNIVRPGITGWAQIVYQYGFDTNDAKQKLMYELYYIKNWTIWFELEICIKTIMVILDKKGF